MKIGVVLRKILIDFLENPLELGKIGEDFYPLIFTAFFGYKSEENPLNIGVFGVLFYGFIFRQIPLTSVFRK